MTPKAVAHQASLSWNSPGKNTGMGNHSLLKGIFLTQGLKSGLHILGRFFNDQAKAAAMKYIPQVGWLKAVEIYSVKYRSPKS